MKKALLATAIAATLPMSAMAMGPIDGKLYGKAFVTIDSVDTEVGSTTTEDRSEVNSNASRIGVKGKTELKEGLYAIYKAEFEMFIDDGEKSSNETFSQRNIYVGLTGAYGTIIAGKHDTPTKLSQKKIDLFNDLNGDIKNTFEGENRTDNIVIYTSPKFGGGFQASAAFAATEEDFDADGNGNNDDGFDGSSIQLSYSNGDLYLSVSQDRDLDQLDLTRLVAQYKMGNLQLGAMYQDAESVFDKSNSSYKDEDGYFLSAKYKMDKITLKAQYGEVDGENGSSADYEEETFSIGADYKLGKKTKALVYYTKNEDQSTSNVETEEKTLGFGMEHKF